MKIVVAIDSFKGCLTSREANEAAAEGIRRMRPSAEVVQVAVSDGGEGFLEAFRAATGGELVSVSVCDPLMHPVTASYLLQGRTAVIEIAQACGLSLLTVQERNPMVATSYGVGQLVADAVGRGAQHIIVGLGGSATSDAGMGMLKALHDVEGLGAVRFTIASDVTNPLYGEHGAAFVFGPQKGASEEMVLLLDRQARQFADESARRFGYDRSGDAGAGAAGGLGYAFMQYLHAACRSGIDLLLDANCFSQTVAHAALVITGEGSADRQTLMGKLPVGILHHSGSVPVCLIAGSIAHSDELLHAGFAHVECINPPGLPLCEAMRKEVAQQNIRHTVSEIVGTFY